MQPSSSCVTNGFSDVEAELSLLTCMYQPPKLKLSDHGEFTQHFPLTLTFQAEPFTCDERSVQFCSAIISISIPESYPDSPIAVEVISSRGLDDAAIAELCQELESMSEEESSFKEPHLLTVLNRASEFVTDRNIANDCPVCLAAIDVRRKTCRNRKSSAKCYRLSPCLHAVHVTCWESWKRELNERISNKVRDLEKIVGRVSAERDARMVLEGLCPMCRTKVNTFDVFDVQTM